MKTTGLCRPSTDSYNAIYFHNGCIYLVWIYVIKRLLSEERERERERERGDCYENTESA